MKARLSGLFCAATLACFGFPDDSVASSHFRFPEALDMTKGNLFSETEFKLHARFPEGINSQPIDRSQYFSLSNAVGDDTLALQAALDEYHKVYLEAGEIYTISSEIALSNGMKLVSDGTAVLHMADGGEFSNSSFSYDDIFGVSAKSAMGLRVTGNGVLLKDFFLVRDFADREDGVVIGIGVQGADNVEIDGLRLRGFSASPGVVSIQHSENVSIRNTLVHLVCTSIDFGSKDAQVTAIAIDTGPGASSGILVENTVLKDLATKVRNQSDGINFGDGGNSVPERTIFKLNHISNAAEGIDIFSSPDRSGSFVDVIGNYIQAHEMGVKIIHSARDITVKENRISGTFVVPNAETDESAAVSVIGTGSIGVSNITISANRIDLSGALLESAPARGNPGIRVIGKEHMPTNILIEENRIFVRDCRQTARDMERSRDRVERHNEKLYFGVLTW